MHVDELGISKKNCDKLETLIDNKVKKTKN